MILSVKNLEKSCTVYPVKCNQAVVWMSRGEVFIYRIPHMGGLAKLLESNLV